jgi:FtsP/CotA-like multicopper oxidase with cupredoxin domain
MRNRKILIVLAVSAVVVAGIFVAGLPLTGGGHQTGTWTPPTNLPSGCKKPADGYLIIVDANGFNGSKIVGSPGVPWPVIQVAEGSTVNIVVCNVDATFAHGFQIGHYFDSNIESVAPDQVITVSFAATKAGTFQIYCSILCPPHIFMQSGFLRLTG